MKIDEDHLPFFITEEIYLVNETETIAKDKREQTLPEAEAAVAKEPEPTYASPVSEQPTEIPKTHELAIWSPPLTGQDKELLVKILAAIKKDFNAAHLMQGINGYEPYFKKLLCFGYQKELEMKIGKSVLMYDPTKIADKEILVSVTPADLHGDPAQKKRLWEALQKMFL